jgi:serine/threonine protein kinase
MAADTSDDALRLPSLAQAGPQTERELREAEDLALAASGLGSGLLKRQPFHDADESVAVLKVCPHCGTEYETAARFCPADGTSLRPKGSDSLIDRVLAERYHILKRIGEGGMGRVYLGEHVKMNRQCAIKVMNPALVNDNESATRFAREASSAARIIHPNVAAVFDFGESDGLVYLVMEFVDGEPLSRILAREAPLSVDRSVDLTRQIADGLGAAHELGIIHRDLKPDNILVARTRAGKEVAKVVDFGIAKAMQETVGEALTRTGLVIGTPEFMSPEQLLGDPIDARSDLYALGCIMHLMLTAVPPFEAPTREQMIKRRLAEDAPSIKAIDPSLPDSLDRIVKRLLARSPTERYGSFAEVRDALSGAHLRAGGNHLPLRASITPTPRSAPTIAFDSLQNATTEVHAAPVPAAAVSPPVPPPAASRRGVFLLAAGGVALAAVLAVTRLADPSSSSGTRDSVVTSAPRKTVVPGPALATSTAALPVATAHDTVAPRKTSLAAAGTTASGSAGVPGAGSVASRADVRRLQNDRVAKARADSLGRAERDLPDFVKSSLRSVATALSSRNMAKLKAAYPLMSGAQEEGWKNLFESADSVRAVADFAGGGAPSISATEIYAPFIMRLRIVKGTGQPLVRNVKERAKFSKEPSGWTLREIIAR